MKRAVCHLFFSLPSSDRRCFGVSNTSNIRGFSLVELLVVVSILVAIAGIGVAVYDNVAEEKKADLVVVELTNVAAAVKQLYADTGFWAGYGTNPHPAAYDWSILRDTSLNNWDEVSRRGWRGPYISRILESKEIGDAAALKVNGLDSGATGDLTVAQSLIDPLNNGVALLALNGRNLIVSPGTDGVFALLPAACDTNVFSELECEENLYRQFCVEPVDAGLLNSDDVYVCP